MNTHIPRLCTLLLLPLAILLGGCDHSIDDRLAAQAAAEKSLGISAELFATRFNRTLADVLTDRKDDDAARMAPLYVIDVTAMVNHKEQYVYQTEVGPARTTIFGHFAGNGDLKSVGALLTERSEGARAEFYLCAETMSRVLTNGPKEKLPDLIKRLTENALNNPGQQMTEVIGDKILSVTIVKSGLLFQIEHQQ